MSGFTNIRAILSFKATSARYTASIGAESGEPFLAFKLEHERRQTVKTPAGADLTNVEWTMQVYGTDIFNKFVSENNGIGTMNHFDMRDDGPSCHISASVGPARFEQLLGILKTGRVPEFISVTAEGLTYGSDYEGRDKTWDVEKSGPFLVTDISFTVPLVEETFADDGGPIESKAIPLNTIHLEAFRTSLQKDMKEMMKPIFVIAFVAVLSGLKYLFR